MSEKSSAIADGVICWFVLDKQPILASPVLRASSRRRVDLLRKERSLPPMATPNTGDAMAGFSF